MPAGFHIVFMALQASPLSSRVRTQQKEGRGKARGGRHCRLAGGITFTPIESLHFAVL